MPKLEELYSDKFFSGRHKYSWRAPIVCGAVRNAVLEFAGKSPVLGVDLGCAVGDLVQGFIDVGIDAVGFEGSMAALPYLECDPTRWFLVDLGKPIQLKNLPMFDFATCFEVAEHIEPQFADQFCDNLSGLSDCLIMSACPPHATREATKYHPNEQPFEYWDEKFNSRGYRRSKDMEEYLKAAWEPWRKIYGIAAYYMNLMCYLRGE